MSQPARKLVVVVAFVAAIAAVVVLNGRAAGGVANASETIHLKRIYGHLGTVRHRARVVEYRVDQHRKALREQLAALRSGAGEH
jgi:hypothetical protein